MAALQVEQLSPEELLASGWQEGCLVLVMPGGADLPYCRVLNGRGNALIQGECVRLRGRGLLLFWHWDVLEHCM